MQCANSTATIQSFIDMVSHLFASNLNLSPIKVRSCAAHTLTSTFYSFHLIMKCIWCLYLCLDNWKFLYRCRDAVKLAILTDTLMPVIHQHCRLNTKRLDDELLDDEFIHKLVSLWFLLKTIIKLFIYIYFCFVKRARSLWQNY